MGCVSFTGLLPKEALTRSVRFLGSPSHCLTQPLALLATYTGTELWAERAPSERSHSTDAHDQTQTQRRRARPKRRAERLAVVYWRLSLSTR
jgi:hypothetical protein